MGKVKGRKKQVPFRLMGHRVIHWAVSYTESLAECKVFDKREKELRVAGGGGGTDSLKVGTHCQTTDPAFQHCPPLNLFLPPPIFEGHRPPPPKIKHSQYKIIYKCDPKSSKQLSI